MLGEGFGAIASLQQEGFARRDLAQHLFQLACFPREDERRKSRELPLDFRQSQSIGVIRHLLNGQSPPALR